MEPTKELADELWRERVLRARRAPPGEKLLDGIRLFDLSCKFMKAGIRDEHPDADEAEVDRILNERIEKLRRLEEARDEQRRRRLEADRST